MKGRYIVYHSGQLVFYGSHGVCRVVDIEKRTVDKKEVEYYALEPLSQRGTRFYVPVHNHVAASKLRNLLSQEAWNLLLADKTLHMDIWVPDENRRVAKYRDIINSGDPQQLLSIVRLLRNHRDSQVASGRKFHICDATILRTAEALLGSELSYVFGRDYNDIL